MSAPEAMSRLGILREKAGDGTTDYFVEVRQSDLAYLLEQWTPFSSFTAEALFDQAVAAATRQFEGRPTARGDALLGNVVGLKVRR